MRKFLFITLCLFLNLTLTNCAQNQTKEPSEGGSDAEMNQELGDAEAAPESAEGDLSALDEVPAVPSDANASLFDRLGGKPMVDKIAGDFVDALATSPEITKNPNVAAAMQKDMARHKSMMSDLICYLAMGPCSYTGKPMKQAHKGLGVASDEWSKMGKLFIEVLKKHNVQKPERVEIATKLARYRDVIVGQ